MPLVFVGFRIPREILDELMSLTNPPKVNLSVLLRQAVNNYLLQFKGDLYAKRQREIEKATRHNFDRMPKS